MVNMNTFWLLASLTTTAMAGTNCFVELEAADMESTKLKCNGTDKCNHPWHFCNNGTCVCGPLPPDDMLRCDDHSLSSHYCISMDEDGNSLNYGLCMYNHQQAYSYFYKPLEFYSFICSDFNRTGILCGECEDNHYPLAHSFDMNCVECPDAKSNWWKFVLATFLPLTIFYFVVMLFQINATSSHLLGMIFFSQGIASPMLSRIFLAGADRFEMPIRGLSLLFALWNLDILRPLKLGICLGTDSLQTISLEFAVGVYPFLLITLSYLLQQLYDSNFKPIVVIWKPFKILFNLFASRWKVKTSPVNAFATFFLLSFIKILNVSFDLLVPVKVHQLNSTGHMSYSWRLYYDATVPYFGEKHLPYGILAIAMLTVCVLLPTPMFVLYPFRCFQSFLNIFPFRWYIFHTFMDTVLGWYKDGTEKGTRDCRSFSSVFFFALIMARVIGAATLTTGFLPLMAIVFILLVGLLVMVQPFKLSAGHHLCKYVCFLLLLATCYVSLSSLQSAPSIVMLAVGATALYEIGLVLKWLYNQRRYGDAVQN